MSGIVRPEVDRYAEAHTTPPPEHLTALAEETRAQLAATVVDTARRARQEAALQAEAALVPVFGERSAAMELLREHLDLPER